MAYYLMVKTAKEFGIKYLCKCGDYQNPYTYKGSGVYWKRIVNKHNPTIETEILGVYETKEALREAGEFFSKKFNIVEDRCWANLIPEIGDGGATTLNRIRAYHPDEKKSIYFNSEEEIPEGWIRGCLPWKKNRDGVEKTRKAHLGKKRSEETRNKMKAAIRKPRKTVLCSKCQKRITPQNIKKHERKCDGGSL